MKDIIISILPILIQFIIAPLLIVVLKNVNAYFKIHIGKTKYEHYQNVVKDIVYQIEKLYPDLAGSEKYKSAFYSINEKLGHILTDQEINTLIESAVQGIDMATKTKDSL